MIYMLEKIYIQVLLKKKVINNGSLAGKIY